MLPQIEKDPMRFRAQAIFLLLLLLIPLSARAELIDSDCETMMRNEPVPLHQGVTFTDGTVQLMERYRKGWQDFCQGKGPDLHELFGWGLELEKRLWVTVDRIVGTEEQIEYFDMVLDRYLPAFDIHIEFLPEARPSAMAFEDFSRHGDEEDRRFFKLLYHAKSSGLPLMVGACINWYPWEDHDAWIELIGQKKSFKPHYRARVESWEPEVRENLTKYLDRMLKFAKEKEGKNGCICNEEVEVARILEALNKGLGKWDQYEVLLGKTKELLGLVKGHKILFEPVPASCSESPF